MIALNCKRRPQLPMSTKDFAFSDSWVYSLNLSIYIVELWYEVIIDEEELHGTGSIVIRLIY